MSNQASHATSLRLFGAIADEAVNSDGFEMWRLALQVLRLEWRNSRCRMV